MARRTIMPKIEISMLVEELTSKEADDLERRKQNKTISTAEKEKNSTSTSPDDSTSDLIKSVMADPVDYDDTTSTVVPIERPMLLSEFADHLAVGIRGKIRTTTPPFPDFPTPKPTVFTSGLPDENFPFMVTAAKEFIRRYLSPEQWRKLRILLKTIKEVGGSRIDIHRAATMFISKVISKTEMAEITERKNELFRTFSRRYFDRV